MKHRNVVCCVCGAVCDDIEVGLVGGEIKVKNACALGRARFQELTNEDRIKEPLVGGVHVDWDQALDKAAKILKNAEHPLIFIGSVTSTETMRQGIRIAEYLGGVVDSHPTLCEGPMIMGIQEAGMPSSTLGEVRNRADLVVFWGANPLQSHLRHLSRYSLFPEGRFRKGGRRDRKLVVVDPRKTKTAEIADLHVQVDPNKDYELMSAVMAILKGNDVGGDVAGVGRETIYELADLMKNCEFGAVFIGLGLASSLGKYRNLERLMKLVRDLNRFTRFVIIPNLGHGNVSGFIQAMTSASGYPFGVDYSRGYPRYNPGEYTTVDLLRRGEVDAMLIVAADLVAHMPRDVVRFMKGIPIVSVNVSQCPTALFSDVVLPGVVAGMESSGTIYRLDNVPLPLKKFVEPPFSFTESDEDTLRQLFDRLRC
ncbi:MAG: formylmethanofuran dehydrogenase subunit B [Candidatus Altiarchaeota archaeon]|nr:formylmethanofuran dehydrogenase subunit B [Candidatus Altiarchaeota archaeon]